jgi:hypothetical protein
MRLSISCAIQIRGKPSGSMPQKIRSKTTFHRCRWRLEFVNKFIKLAQIISEMNLLDFFWDENTSEINRIRLTAELLDSCRVAAI